MPVNTVPQPQKRANKRTYARVRATDPPPCAYVLMCSRRLIGTAFMCDCCKTPRNLYDITAHKPAHKPVPSEREARSAQRNAAAWRRPGRDGHVAGHARLAETKTHSRAAVLHQFSPRCSLKAIVCRARRPCVAAHRVPRANFGFFTVRFCKNVRFHISSSMGFTSPAIAVAFALKSGGVDWPRLFRARPVPLAGKPGIQTARLETALLARGGASSVF